MIDELGDLEIEGIIPTRMGTRSTYGRHTAGAWDHPHAYGDKVLHLRLPEELKGSSPRVWGQEVPLGAEKR